MHVAGGETALSIEPSHVLSVRNPLDTKESPFRGAAQGRGSHGRKSNQLWGPRWRPGASGATNAVSRLRCAGRHE